MLSRGHLVGAAAQHRCSEAVHDRLGLDVKVPIKLVGSPATDHPDALATNTRAEEGHGAAGSRRAGGHVRGAVARVRVKGEGHSDPTSYVAGANEAPRTGAVGVQRGCRVGVDGTEIDDTINEAEHGAQVGVARTAVAHCLVAHPVLLACKRQSGEGGGVEIGNGTVKVVQRTGAHPEGEVAEAKEGVQRIIGRAHVFAWA